MNCSAKGRAGYFARGTSSSGVFARYRLNHRLDWSMKNWTAGIAHTYVPSLDDLTNPTAFRVAKYHSFDLQFGHNFTNTGAKWLKGLQTMVGVNNVFNKYPPFIHPPGRSSQEGCNFPGLDVFSCHVHRFVCPYFDCVAPPVHREPAALGRKCVLFRAGGHTILSRS